MHNGSGNPISATILMSGIVIPVEKEIMTNRPDSDSECKPNLKEKSTNN